MLELAKLYRAEEGDCHWEPKLESVIHLALGYWFREKPVCKNWWYNQIGVPKTLGPAFLLMKEQLNPEEKEAAIEVMENAKFGMTGQNKVWLAGNVLMRGLLQDDFELVKAAVILLYPRLRLVCRKESKATGAFISTDRSNNRKLRIGFPDGDEFLFRPVCGNRFCPEQGTTGNFEFFPSERLSLDCLERVYGCQCTGPAIVS